jgi:hypothetical protein
MVLFAQLAQTVALALLAQIPVYTQSPAFPLMVALPQMVVFASKVPFTPIVLYAQLVAFAHSGLEPVKPPQDGPDVPDVEAARVDPRNVASRPFDVPGRQLDQTTGPRRKRVLAPDRRSRPLRAARPQDTQEADPLRL